MRGAASAFVLALAAGAFADDRPEERVFVEVVADKAAYLVGETATLRLRVGFESEWFVQHAVPLFARRVGIPARVECAWLWGVGDRWKVAEPPPTPIRLPTWSLLAVNDDAVGARGVDGVVRAGRPYTVWEVEWRVFAGEPGSQALDAPKLRFAWTTKFENNALGERVSTDRHEGFVLGAPLSLTVADPPAAERPDSFTGAVGVFTVAADAAPRALRVGESLKLTLTLDGTGNQPHFDPPALDGLDGFHVLGATDDRGAPRRTVVYDLSPTRDDVRAVPPIAFVFLDPGPPPAYRTVRTDPIAIDVKSGPDASPRSADGDGAQPRGGVPATVVVAIVVAVFAAFGFVMLRRSRKPPETDPDAERIRAAVAAVRAGHTDLADSFAGYLAARLHCAPAAVVDPDLAKRLVAAGVPADLAGRAAALVESLVSSRYGAARDPGVDARARELVDALENSFARSAA